MLQYPKRLARVCNTHHIWSDVSLLSIVVAQNRDQALTSTYYACSRLTNWYKQVPLTAPVAFAVDKNDLLDDRLPQMHEIQDLLSRQLCRTEAFPELFVCGSPVAPYNRCVYCCDQLVPKVCKT